VIQAKQYIDTLLQAGLITRAQQLDARDRCDVLMAAALVGVVPPSWCVEVDPETGTLPPPTPNPETISAPAS